MNHPDQQKQAEGAAPIPDAVPTPPPRPSDRQARLERFLARASLNPEHISELRKSGITYDQALRAGFRTMTNRESIREILCW